jgi:hypothetical protein
MTNDDYPSKEEILKTISDAVYAQYPKKEWQELTDDEIVNSIVPIASYDVFDLPDEAIKLGRAIQQALKDKNA